MRPQSPPGSFTSLFPVAMNLGITPTMQRKANAVEMQPAGYVPSTAAADNTTPAPIRMPGFNMI